ncbi:hypothetical protein MKX08_004054 [Trichoderma sp. CBMAI-0020]|nr:hypothetical protein MKX08_004054 [Trichoderma sp. CBMAI-0020]
MLTKWAKYLSVEVNLPASLSGCLRDIVIFEMLKTHWGHCFNRYAWIILFGVDGVALDYYAPDTIQLGHTISYMAKQTLFKINLENHDDDDMAIEDWEKLLEKLENDFLDSRDKEQLSQYFTNLVKTASIPKEGNDRHNDETVSEQDDKADVNETVMGERGPLSSEFLITSDLESVSSEKAHEAGSERIDQTDSEKEDEANGEEEGGNDVGLYIVTPDTGICFKVFSARIPIATAIIVE